MQHPNNDMDNLFRRAAEDYPLNTGSADWEKVSAMLAQKEEETQTPENRNHFWLLLLLLPLTLICNRLSDGVMYPEVQASKSSSHFPVSAKPGPAAHESDQSANKSRPIAGSRRNHQPEESNSTDFLSLALLKQNRASLPVDAKKTAADLPPVFEPHEFSQNADKQPVSATPNETVPFVPIDAINTTEDGNMITVENSLPETKTTLTADTAKNERNPTPIPEQKASSGKKRFFVSLVAGPDITTVKFQQFSEIGLQAGMLFGYQINRRFAVEAGVLSGRKFYKSDGEYFNKSKLYLPPNTEMVAVNGKCRMLELPVMVRYNFSEAKKRTFFASAGFSSYLMQSEDYKYNYLYTASGYVATYRKFYKNQTRNWFAVFQLSGGFFYPLGKVGQLRVEPYYALPLKGIGYGEMPLSSFGVRLGLKSNRF